MSVLDNQTKANQSLSFFALAGTGAGGASNLNQSTLVLTAGPTSSIFEVYQGDARWQLIDNGNTIAEIRLDTLTQGIIMDTGSAELALEASTFRFDTVLSGPTMVISSIDAGYVGANEVDTNFVSTSVLDIDGQLLTANASNLLLNGIPVASLSSLSSLSDWSLEPAISSVQMAGYDIVGAKNITASNLSMEGALSSLSVVAQSGFFQDLSTVTFTALSTIHAVSTISSVVLEAQQVNVSTLYASAFLSTPDIECSSINGATFGSSSITVEVMGVSSLVATSISSLGAVLQTALVSTLQFNPSFNPSVDVSLGLGSLFGNLAGAAAGGIGVLVGAAGLGTGLAALAQGRQTNFINSNSYELVNGTTQLQVSTLGTSFSTVYRFVNSPAENVPGEEIFVSTIYPAGPAIRSLSDPLNTVSSPNSTIQSFGQWVSLGDLQPPSTVSTFAELVLTPSTLLYSATTDAELVVATPSDSNDYGQVACSALRLASSSTASNGIVFYNSATDRLNFVDDGLVNHTLAYTVDNTVNISSVFASSVTVQGQVFIAPSTVRSGVYMPFDPTNGTGVVAVGFSTGSIFNQYGALLAAGLGGSATQVMTVLETKDAEVSFQFGDLQAGRLFLNGLNNYAVQPSASLAGDLNGNLTLGAGVVAATSSLTASTITARTASLSNVVGISTILWRTAGPAYTLSSLQQITPPIAGAPAGSTSTLMTFNTDLSIGFNDLFCGQLRIDAGANAVSEVVMTGPDDNIATFDLATADKTIRIRGTGPVGTLSTGYILDTGVNPLFFSSLGGVSSVLMSFFPSTTNSTIGVSTITNITPPSYYASVYSSTSQTVAGANTATNATWNTTSLNRGGFTIGTSTITVPVAGDYEITASFQFDTSSGGTNNAEFWLTKNGSNVPQTNSVVSVVNNGETLGTISIWDTAVANDRYGWVFYSADNNMTAAAIAAGATPAVPSVIANIRRLG